MNDMPKCATCGGDYLLHQAETNRCPRGGHEAPFGQAQVWLDTAYVSDCDACRAEAAPVPSPKIGTDTPGEGHRVRCNHCMSEFDEEYIDVDATNYDSGETCPCCGKGDALMDLDEAQHPEFQTADDLDAECSKRQLRIYALTKAIKDMMANRLWPDELREIAEKAIQEEGSDD